MQFWLGAHMPHWLDRVDVPLFVSHRQLARRVNMPRSTTPWALDSGAFTELALNGRFETTPRQYIAAVNRYRQEVGHLAWAAPQDHMTEPWVLAHSQLASTVPQAQAWTVANYLELRSIDDTQPIIPVLQGQTMADYDHCIHLYEQAGIDLEAEPLIGLGSVCRRQATDEIAEIVANLAHLPLHGFGVKTSGLDRYGWLLRSADSMAWSYRGRRIQPCPVKGLTSCANCLHFALTWRTNALTGLESHTPVQMALF